MPWTTPSSRLPSTCSSSRSRRHPALVDYLKQMEDFRSGTSNVGTTWQIITNLLKGETPPVAVDVIKPPRVPRAGPTPG
jgi:hypothetical protein